MKQNIFLIILLLSACKQYETSNPLIGMWLFKTYGIINTKQSTVTFIKTNVLDKNNFGITFMEDNKVTAYKNIGYCGVPPVFYDKCDGKWTQDGKQICIKASGIFEKINECYEIISIDNKTLVLKYIK